MRLTQGSLSFGVVRVFAILVAFGSIARADFIFDPDGTANPTNPAFSIRGFDPSPGNALGQGEITAINNFVAGSGPTTFQLNYQANIGGLFSSAGGTFTPNGLGTPGAPNSTFELTLVGSVTEQITGVNLATNTVNYAVAPVQANNSILQMYYGAGASFDSNNLSGTGFKNGNLILTASPFKSAGGIGNFTNSGTTDLYDQFGNDDYGGKQTVVGSGGLRVDFQVTSVDPSFFITTPDSMQLAFRGDSQVPFFAVDPSRLFPGLGSGGTDVVPNLGATNGTSGPDFQFQSDGQLTQLVPEPSTMLLFSAAGAMLLWRGRRKSG
jgi:hypothetical protein